MLNSKKGYNRQIDHPALPYKFILGNSWKKSGVHGVKNKGTKLKKSRITIYYNKRKGRTSLFLPEGEILLFLFKPTM